ncbi:hypothetical protein GLOIN_2v1718866 [Rhizophagus irregularis DAOM 181602=DAOM 197198]|uniref:PB1 domain-containing protein n=2 Tax=Rhizophagus irregularis TaxID=588596 RepID=A0A015I973_RHIIW|nr:hypothetical protein GLOIN_2v1718866 [Rhizophagus irregularis DAOM 181602=DAOM 197198]EXX53737.1 hypothetical protein RirG_241170 [Rhizophagus irregularis DAOM 197198w]POG59821.1 hypothetical protein GLOIN_2v1718866 [Rhizophagus irregularis DAOM 181602=DAOM 197198]|eukprot:XP_025166687.1 hypothetical protein GLOIN_2v1718866 [Rhizophagus irregularis DAOM 181602=DAOM 197198]
MYRTKGYNNNNYGDQQLWIKVDLKEIRFYPSRDIIRKFQCRQIELLFKYTNNCIAINFIEGREVHEIRIPLEQITKFRVIQNKHIEFEFCKDFRRAYFVHLKNNQNSNTVHKTQKDPTSGCIKDATKLSFTPCDKVHPMTIFMFEIGIKKWAPRLIESEDDKDEIQIHEDLIIEDNPSLNPSLHSITSEYLMTCNFMDFTSDIRLPAEITFSDLLKEINRKLECDVNTFKYKINDEEMIMVENEGDWNIAKMNLREQKISCFDIYIVE